MEPGTTRTCNDIYYVNVYKNVFEQMTAVQKACVDHVYAMVNGQNIIDVDNNFFFLGHMIDKDLMVSYFIICRKEA